MTTEKQCEPYFNLLDESWILVRNLQGDIEELSLLEVFRRAHELEGLAGESPTQDIAILRLLLAILYAVFTRSDATGKAALLVGFPKVEQKDEALRRWKALWDGETLPLEPIRQYLEFYRDRFWLIHPDKPFYQVNGLKKATEYPAAKLIGNLAESNNKPRQFSMRSGEQKTYLKASEATRWLLHLNGFDDTSSKPSVRGAGLPSVGAGWLGKLGLVQVVGKSLRETLLLNLVLLNYDNYAAFPEQDAYWELEDIRTDERIAIPQPGGPLPILTVQSRRIELIWDQDQISGYRLIGGDYFEKENCFAEQMTLWRKDQKAKFLQYVPKRHNAERQMWRDFASLLVSGEGHKRAGVVEWLTLLRDETDKTGESYLKESAVWFAITGIKYGDKDFYVDDIIFDTLGINAGLLNSFSSDWINRILDELEKTESCIWAFANFATDLARASGSMGDNKSKDVEGVRATARMQAYHSLDSDFREWLLGIDPSKRDLDDQMRCWQDVVRKTITALGEDLVIDCAETTLVGRMSPDGTWTAKPAPVAWMQFRRKINEILKSAREEDNDE